MAEDSTRSPQQAPGDAELIAAVLEGRTERFQPLMERHQQAIHAYLFRFLLGDTETARDLTQTVFLKAFRNLRAVDPARPFAPWLYRIAHNEAANHLRSRARRPESGLEPDHWARLPAAEGNDPEANRLEAEEQAALRSALAQLAPRQREVVMLHYFEDKSYEEIAEILAMPLGTVGTLMHRARRRLRDLLA
jgi:RNA polymerase sigma-70 factor (ECF subfamily)